MSAADRPLKTRPAAPTDALQDIDPDLARVFAARGVRAADELDYGLGRLLPVRTLPEVEKAVALLLEHRDRRVLVVGDFDADGATSTALVLRCLREFGFAEVSFLVPNRFEFGYGLTPELVAVARERAPTLIVTVDNGISSVDGVASARDAGIDVLVTDHHLPGTARPNANVVLNPNADSAGVALKNLAGVGVAFYLMAALGHALTQAGQNAANRVPARYLDLVALGTVADVVPLDHNNRILVEQGLKRIRAQTAVPGILALLRQAGRSPSRTVSSDLAFAVGPRLNAAGRLKDMSEGIECLLADAHDEAARYAECLDRTNLARREIEQSMRERAFAIVDGVSAPELPCCISLYEKDWHSGVVGLVAARVRERWHRPAFAFAAERQGSDVLKGSGRSVPDVHLRDLLEAIDSGNPGLLGKFGGHAMAAGLTILAADFPSFQRAAAATLASRYPMLDVSGAILSDGVLPSAKMNRDFAEVLRSAGPWGSGFPEPVFHGDFRVVDQRIVGERHIKMRVLPTGAREPLDAIAFNQAHPGLRGDVRLAYRLDVNDYRGVETAQLIVEQITRL